MSVRPALALAALLSTPVVAADTQPIDLGATTVTATKAERLVFETPAAVSTLDADDVANAAPYGYDDVLASVPGIAVHGGPRRIAEEPAIRGFRDEQVVIRVDGARQNFNAAHRGRFLVDPDLLERVEVLRGGQSAIYGSGALGGVISLETKDARDYLDEDGIGARVRLGYRTNGDEPAGYLTTFVRGGRVDGLAAFAYRDVRDDLKDGAGTPLLATQDRVANALVKLGFELADGHRLEFTAEDYDNAGINPTNANDDATPSNVVDRDTQRDGQRLRYTGAGLTAVVYTYDTEVDERRIGDGRRDITLSATDGFDVYHRATLGGATLVYGVEGYRDEQSGLRNGAARPEFPDADADYRAYYVQADIPLGERVSLLPGVRYDKFESSAAGFGSRDDSELSPRVSVGWRASDDLYLWAGASESFRAPSLTELYADGVHFVAPLGPGQVVINEFLPTPDLAPERAKNVEVGARHRWSEAGGAQWSLSANAWRSRVDGFVDQVVVFISGAPTFDPVTNQLVFPGFTTNVNADADLKGWELELQRDARDWYVKLGAAASDGERRATGEGLASQQQDRAHVESGVFFGDALVGARFVAAAAQDDVPAGSLTTPGYGVFDVFGAYTVHGFELRASVHNVLDREYRIHPNGVNQVGRSFQVSIARNFGG